MIASASRSPLRRALGAALVLAAVTAAGVASADVPPPDGIKRVGYGFTVSNLAAFPGHVVVAYPWSTSNGAPTTEHAVVSDGVMVPVGARSAPPRLWVVKKADWEAFAATHRPSGSYEDAPLTAFFETSGKATACDLAPQVRTEIPEEDPRDRVVDAFRAEAIADGRCHLVAAAAPATTGGGPTGDAPAPAPAASSPAPSTGGCAGCHVGTTSHGAGALAFLAAAIAVAIRSARRR